MKRSVTGFTIVELLIVIVVIAILAAISVVAFTGVQARARDSGRIAKVKDLAKALELYKVDNGRYPAILDGHGVETSCGSQTENWGQCDRMKHLTDAVDPYIKIDPTSLSNATQGNYYYFYNSSAANGNQTYGLMVYLEGNGGQSDGGYHTSAYELGQDPKYCSNTYSGTNARWGWSVALGDARCYGGN